MGREKNDKPLVSATARPNTFMRGGSSKDLLDNQSQEEQRREMLETVKQLTGGADVEAERSKARESGERLRKRVRLADPSTCKGQDFTPLGMNFRVTP